MGINDNQANLLYKALIYTIKLSSPFVFQDVDIYFRNNIKTIPTPNPTVIFANHIAEYDVSAIAYLFPYIYPKIKFSFPMRQDISEEKFLQKEFKQKGFVGLLFQIIDFTNVIPRALKYIGGLPIKRPFRDDARNLIKSGELEKIIEEQWSILSESIKSGRNIFLFPEGKFGYSGGVDPIRKGIWLLGQKIENLNYVPVTFTYDFLSYEKPALHIFVGNNKKYNLNLGEKETLNQLRIELSTNFVITPANLFSYLIMRPFMEKGIPKGKLIEKIIYIATQIHLSGKYKVSNEFFQKKIKTRILKLIQKAIGENFLIQSSEVVVSSDKLHTTEFTSLRLCRKLNPYFYHSNQLKMQSNDIEQLMYFAPSED